MVAVLKVRRVPIEIDVGALVVGHGSRVIPTQVQQVEFAHGVDVSNRVVGIEAEAWSADFHLDVLRHLECGIKSTVFHLYPSVIQHILMIVDIRGIGGILHSHLGLLVEELQPQLSVEIGVEFSVRRQDLSFNSHHTHGMKLHATCLSIHPIDSHQGDIILGYREAQSRVAQEQKRDVLAFHRCAYRVVSRIDFGHSHYVAKAHREAVSFPLVEHTHQCFA